MIDFWVNFRCRNGGAKAAKREEWASALCEQVRSDYAPSVANALLGMELL